MSNVSDSKPEPNVAPKYASTTYNRTIYAFKYGLPISHDEIDKLIDRVGYAKKITDGITQQSIGDGFDLVDDNDEKLDINDKFLKLAEDTELFEQVVRTISMSRRYGRIDVLFYSNGRIRPFRPQDIQFSYPDVVSPEPEFVTFDEIKEVLPDAIFFTFRFADNAASDKTIGVKLQHNDEDPYLQIIYEEKHKIGEGRCILEPIWDVLNSCNDMFFMMALHTNKNSVGPKIIKHDVVAGSTEEALIYTMLDRADYNLKLILPHGAEWVDASTSGQFNFEQVHKTNMKALSAYTGYPLSYWEGDPSGQLAGAEMNAKREKLKDKDLQNEAIKHIKKIVRKLSIGRFTLPDKFFIKWRVETEVSEKEQADLSLTENQAIQLQSSYKTGAEIRKDQDLGPLPNMPAEWADIPLEIFLQKFLSNFTIDVEGNINESTPPKPPGFGSESDEQTNDMDSNELPQSIPANPEISTTAT